MKNWIGVQPSDVADLKCGISHPVLSIIKEAKVQVFLVRFRFFI